MVRRFVACTVRSLHCSLLTLARRVLPDRLSLMSQPLTANDLLPLVARLAPGEREHLVRLITETSERDASVCLAAPPRQDEFTSDQESLAWDAEGWEGLE